MTEINITDEFGKRTVFTGQRLVDEHTDTSDGRKPQWVQISVWRTEAGSFVVRTLTCYRVRHQDKGCRRAEGYDLTKPMSDDTFPCSSCNQDGDLVGGWAQASRMTVEAHHTPQALIDSFQTDGRHSNLARSILADISDEDEGVDALWNTVRIA
jgi:hypothetical protein